MPCFTAGPVRTVSVSGLRGGRHGGRLRRVPHDPARQHHAHGPGAGTDVETTARTFDPMLFITSPHVYFMLDLTPALCLSLGHQGAVVSKSQEHNKPRTGRDIARVTFDLYRINPKDVFGSLNVKATFQGLYSVSANFECLGPKKILRYVKREDDDADASLNDFILLKNSFQSMGGAPSKGPHVDLGCCEM